MLSISARGYRAKHDERARFLVQSGAFKEARNAEAHCSRLIHRGFVVTRGRDKRWGRLFYCRSSHVYTYAAALRLIKALRKKRIPATIVVQSRRKRSKIVASQGRKRKSTLLADLAGSWCGNPTTYGKAPIQTWSVSGNRVSIELSARESPERKPKKLNETIEILPNRTVKLIGETSTYRSVTIYRIGDGRLSGISYRQEMKATGMTMTAVPDTLRRCH